MTSILSKNYGIKHVFFHKAAFITVFAIFASVIFPGPATAEIKKISIVTPEWEEQTNKDGSGLFFEIINVK